ncbi:MAG: hypothetical protein ACO3K7_01545 [Candidatus Marinamargulisbacteria bacterium]
MTQIPNHINNIKNVGQLAGASTGVSPDAAASFGALFKDATAAMAGKAMGAAMAGSESVAGQSVAASANMGANELEKRRQKASVAPTHRVMSLEAMDPTYLAQANTGVAQNAAAANPQSLRVVPLQIFLDNAIKSLQNVSDQEFRMNDLIDGFIKGNVSEDEVVLATAKLNLSISMVTTIVQSAVQTFKEIQQIPV